MDSINNVNPSDTLVVFLPGLRETIPPFPRHQVGSTAEVGETEEEGEEEELVAEIISREIGQFPCLSLDWP